MRSPHPLKPVALVAALVTALAVAGAGQAQTNSTGNVAGIAAAGDVVVLKNPKTGFTRTLKVGKSGHYRLAALPTGDYVVTVKHADGTVYLEKKAAVRIGQTTAIK
jgi:hypothetical protein